MNPHDIIQAYHRAIAADRSREEGPHHEIRVGIVGVLERVADHLDEQGKSWSAAELRAIAALMAPGGA